MKWTDKEVSKLNFRGSQMVSNKMLSIRELSEKMQSKYFKNRSVESVRHKIRELINS